MLMTEKDAATRWCPHSPKSSKGFCLGSGCTAWRWKVDPAARVANIPMYAPTGEKWSCEHCGGTGKLATPAVDAADAPPACAELRLQRRAARAAGKAAR